MPRLFIGVELPEEIKEELAELKLLTPRIDSARWIEKQNLHLTLKFLGHVPEELVEILSKRIEASVRGGGAFEFALGEAGAFPTRRRARILWYGVDDGEDALEKLAGSIEAAAETCGYRPEKRPFHPHITLARIKTPQDVSSALEAIDGKLRNRAVSVPHVALFESILKRTGAEYSVIDRFRLE